MKNRMIVFCGLIGAAMFAVVGCSSVENKSVRLNGYVARVSEAGMTLGKADITTIPSSMNYFHAQYNEDVALFSPSTKIRNWSVTCTGGTNDAPESVANAINTLAAFVRAAAEDDAKAVTNGTKAAVH